MPHQNIDVKTAKQWLDNKEAIIIDVREPHEYNHGHIPGSQHIPLGEIQPEHLNPFKNKKIIIHCASGGRSNQACLQLANQDPDAKLFNLEGGITAWQRAGFEVKSPSGKKPGLAIDRQVQLTIGSGVLIGLGLGYFIHPGFLLISAFFGAGLIFAGSTGTCGLAMLMSKMPWNK